MTTFVQQDALFYLAHEVVEVSPKAWSDLYEQVFPRTIGGQQQCGRCGAWTYYGTRAINHDLGYCGCPIETDPVWREHPPGRGFRTIVDVDGRWRSQLFGEGEMENRYDAALLPLCETCFHPHGLHPWGRPCSLCHDCDGYTLRRPILLTREELNERETAVA